MAHRFIRSFRMPCSSRNTNKVCKSLTTLPHRAIQRMFSISNTYCFTTTPARYNGITIDVKVSPITADMATFTRDLDLASAVWKGEDRGSIWIKCDVSQGDIISAAAAADFVFHHAEGREATLHKWLKDRKCPVPPFATHQVGVGAVVIDDNERLLVVREAGLYRTKQWKFPTGLVDLGEDFGVAAEREVMEETGIRATFQHLMSFTHRHQHTNVSFGRSDIFALCHLKPLSFDITIDPHELDDACWMPVTDFMKHSSHPLSRYAVTTALYEQERQKQNNRDVPSHVIAEEQVYVPVLKTEVKIYKPAAAPRVKDFAVAT